MSGHAPYILIADDDPDDQEMFTEWFRRLNPHTRMEFADNGDEALSFLKAQPAGDLPRVILVDYKMPILTGYDLLRIIEKDPRYQSIIKVVWSTSNNQEYIDQCLESGAKEYFVKPDNIPELEKIAAEVSRLLNAPNGSTRS